MLLSMPGNVLTLDDVSARLETVRTAIVRLGGSRAAVFGSVRRVQLTYGGWLAMHSR